jgi:hypothetical protein
MTAKLAPDLASTYFDLWTALGRASRSGYSSAGRSSISSETSSPGRGMPAGGAMKLVGVSHRKRAQLNREHMSFVRAVGVASKE